MAIARGGGGEAFRTRLVAALAIVAAVATARGAAATVVLAVDFTQQCADADTIVVGTVRDVTSRPMPTNPAFFETLVTLDVQEVVAGTAASPLTLRLAGGEIGGVRQSIDGMPEFAAGERYVVFLDRPEDPPLVSPIVGFNQGLYRVERVGDADVVHDRAGAPLSEAAVVALVGAERNVAPRPPGAEANSASPSLDRFLAAIRATRPQ